MKQSVIIIDSSVAVTGGLKCASRMAELLEPWAKITLVLPSNSDVPANELRAFEEVVRIPILSMRKSVPTILAYLPAALISGLQLRKLLRRKRAAALVVNDFFLLHGWIVRALGFRGRIVTWVRFDPRRFPAMLSRAWLAAAVAASDEIVAVSKFVRGRLPASVFARVIYDTIDPGLPIGREVQIDRRDIVYVGNYIRGKGQDHAIKVFRMIAGRFLDARLVFHGGDMGLEKNRSFREDLMRRCHSFGLQDRVLFGGYAKDLAPVFAKAAVALNLSESETFSLTCLEASQCGVPVIAFRSGGPEEIIDDGLTGLLCELGNINAAAEALCALLSDPARSKRMGEAAAQHVANKFGINAYVGQVRTLLQV